MKHFALLIAALFLFSCGSKNQPIAEINKAKPISQPNLFSITIKLTNADNASLPPSLLLYRYYFDKYELSDTIAGKGNLYTITFKAPFDEGLFGFRTKTGKMNALIIGRTDSNIEINASLEQVEQAQALPVSSKENMAYMALLNLADARDRQVDSLKKNASAVSRVDKQYYTDKALQRESALRKIKAFYPAFDALAQKYPNTYAAEILLPAMKQSTRLDNDLYKEYDNDHAFNHRHYFDRYNMNDRRVLAHPQLIFALRSYLDDAKGEFEVDYKRAGDYLATLSKNDEVQKLITEYTIQYFVNLPHENTALYIAQKHIKGCTDDYLETLKSKAEFNRGASVGALAPNISFQTNATSLNNICSGNKITLLLFWKSNCSHCLEELPNLIRLYELYNNKQFEIIAIGLDSDKNAWSSHIEKENHKWKNHHITDVNGSLQQIYPISSTPSIYLINNNRKIMAKDIGGKVLNEFLKKYFEEKK